MEPTGRIAFDYPIYALDILPDGRLAVAGGGGLMKSGIPNKCALLSFHPDSASFSEQASVDLSDTAVALATSGTTLHIVTGPGVKNFSCADSNLTPHSSFRHDLRVSASQYQSAIAVSEDSSLLVVASDEGHVVSLSLPRYEQLFSAHLHNQGITDLSISQDGSLVATTSRDRVAYLWRSDSGDVVQTLKPVMPPTIRTHIRAIRFPSSQPNIIFTAESNPRKGGWMAAWEKSSHTHTTSYTPIASFKASADAVTACAVNRAGSLVAVSSSEGHVSLLRWGGSSFSCLWSTEAKTDWISAPRPPHVLPITGMCFSESGEYLFTASADYTVAVWPVRRPMNWRRVTRITLWVLSLLIGLFAVLVAEDRHLPTLLRYHRGRLQPHLEPHLSTLQGSVRPFFRDRQAQIQPYISDVQHAIEPHLKYAGEQIRPYTNKVREHRTRWQSMLQSVCSQIMRYGNYVSSLTSTSSMKDPRKMQGVSNERESKGDVLPTGSIKANPTYLGPEYVEQKKYAERRRTAEEAVREGEPLFDHFPSETQVSSTIRSSTTSKYDNSVHAVSRESIDSKLEESIESGVFILHDENDISNPPHASGRQEQISDRETVSPPRKEQGSARYGGHSNRNNSLPTQARKHFMGHTINEKDTQRLLGFSRNEASASKDDTLRRNLETLKDYEIHEETLGPKTTTDNADKEFTFRSVIDDQPGEPALTENRYPEDTATSFAESTQGPYEANADDGERDVGFRVVDGGTHLSMVLHETGPQAFRGETIAKRLIMEGDSDEEKQAEPGMSEIYGQFDNQDVSAGLTSNRIDSEEEVLHDVSRKISLILSESSHSITDVPQTKHEESDSPTGSKGTVIGKIT